METYGKVKRTRFFAVIAVLLSSMVAMLLLSGCSSDRTYTVAGKVTSGGIALPGVTVTLSGDASMTTVTDVNGNYTFSAVSGGIYKVTPSLTGYTIFSPPYRNVFLDGIDAIGFNFSRSGEGRISAANHTIALKSDSTVWTWGNNSNGQLGNGGTAQSAVPAAVSGMSGVIVAAGNTHTAALKSDGTVWTWGNNSSGQLGNGTTVQSLIPVQVNDLVNVIAIAAGSDHTVALKSDGTVWAWGNNSNGQLGNGSTAQSLIPVQATGVTGVTAIAAGSAHTVVLKSDGTVWAWGNNGNGQLGTGSLSQRTTAGQVSGLVNVIAVAAGHAHTAALRNDITDVSVWVWGNNSSGQLGNDTTTQSAVPVLAGGGLSGITAIAAGHDHTAALRNDGTVWAWGNNSKGQLGDGTAVQRLLPVQVSGLTSAMAVAAGYTHTVVLKNDGTVWTWGGNADGQLGDGTTTDRLTPVQALGL